MAKERPCLPMQKAPKRAGKLLSTDGGELNKKFIQNEVMSYALGGGTHNTYSGKRKKKK